MSKARSRPGEGSTTGDPAFKRSGRRAPPRNLGAAASGRLGQCPIRAQTSENRGMKGSGGTEPFHAQITQPSHFSPPSRTSRQRPANPVEARPLIRILSPEVLVGRAENEGAAETAPSFPVVISRSGPRVVPVPEVVAGRLRVSTGGCRGARRSDRQ